MNEQSVVCIYNRMSQAEEAINALSRRGFPIDQISIIAQDLESEKDVQGYVTVGDVAKSGAGTGAWVGGLFGLLIGAAFVWVPGFGPLMVAGPFAAALAGGLEGAAVGAAGGGLLGALIGWGVSKEHILKYEEHLKGGKYLLIAHGSLADVAQARQILRDTSPAELHVHGETAVPVR